jgi:hypothetical protein
MKTAFLSALGAMGRRHLKGLVRAGFSVSAYDVNEGLEEIVNKELIAANLPPSELPQRLTNLLAAYDRQRRDEQSFREFVNQQPVAQLQVWLTASSGGER